MKIVSWNVNGIRACEKKGFLQFVGKHKPDILCLQETKAHVDQLDTSLKKIKSYEAYWSISEVPGYSGVVTYSKKKPTSVSYELGIYKFDREGRFAITHYDDFVLFNIYFPNGAKDETRHLFKQEFLKKLHYHLSKFIKEGKEIIIVGDYNVAYLDIDVYDPKSLSTVSGFLPEEREWFKSFLSLGFIDVYRHFHPKEEKAFTWWSYRENARKNNRGWRIDHICVTSGLKKRLKSIDILSQVIGSDHCPIQLTLS